MNNFTFYSPTFFAFGKGKEQETGKLVKRFGGRRYFCTMAAALSCAPVF